MCATRHYDEVSPRHLLEGLGSERTGLVDYQWLLMEIGK